MWRCLLKRVEAFTAERVEELAVYLEKAKRQEMRQEVLREAAHRLKAQEVHVDFQEGLLMDFFHGHKMKFLLTIPGWGTPHTLEMDVWLRDVVTKHFQLS